MVHLIEGQPIKLPYLTPQDLIDEFTANLKRYSWADLFSVLDHELAPLVRVILRAAIRAKEKNQAFTLTLERALKRVNQIENTKRKNTVRRLYKKWGLFAMEEINKIYPDYNSEMLPGDVLIKRSMCKAGKKKTKYDFRTLQLEKLEVLYQTTEVDTIEYNKICERIASLTYAHKCRKPIVLRVKLTGETYAYPFHWTTPERTIKEFHALANTQGITHAELQSYRENALNSPVKF
ncbi:hypothetical protein [Mucilaginibacter kameinonensis]|uniref:hypothetical protein n=1 Tax=Mucilaginibacter kameinonensis TaxID=452286 RepID=UPI000EF83318|nr:hypothetical protein [Mucilaginibacter kameinonensis]